MTLVAVVIAYLRARCLVLEVARTKASWSYEITSVLRLTRLKVLHVFSSYVLRRTLQLAKKMIRAPRTNPRHEPWVLTKYAKRVAKKAREN